MNILQDMVFVNKKAFKKSGKLFVDNWPIIFTGLAYTTINIIMFMLIGLLFRGVLGIIGGLIAVIVTSATISNYLYLLNNIIFTGKFNFQDFKEGFKIYLWKVYGVFFVGWIFSILFNLAIAPILYRIISPYIVGTVINILLLIVLNPLPESLYQKYYSPWETIMYAFEFIKENWIEWFLPNVVLMLLLYLTTGNFIADIFAIQHSIGFRLGIKGILLYIIGQIIFSFIMIFRGVLFQMLSTSTRRKRKYMRNFYE